MRRSFFTESTTTSSSSKPISWIGKQAMTGVSANRQIATKTWIAAWTPKGSGHGLPEVGLLTDLIKPKQGIIKLVLMSYLQLLSASFNSKFSRPSVSAKPRLFLNGRK